MVVWWWFTTVKNRSFASSLDPSWEPTQGQVKNAPSRCPSKSWGWLLAAHDCFYLAAACSDHQSGITCVHSKRQPCIWYQSSLSVRLGSLFLLRHVLKAKMLDLQCPVARVCLVLVHPLRVCIIKFAMANGVHLLDDFASVVTQRFQFAHQIVTLPRGKHAPGKGKRRERMRTAWNLEVPLSRNSLGIVVIAR